MQDRNIFRRMLLTVQLEVAISIKARFVWLEDIKILVYMDIKGYGMGHEEVSD
jgi:hypothetical protein